MNEETRGGRRRRRDVINQRANATFNVVKSEIRQFNRGKYRGYISLRCKALNVNVTNRLKLSHASGERERG